MYLPIFRLASAPMAALLCVGLLLSSGSAVAESSSSTKPPPCTQTTYSQAGSGPSVVPSTTGPYGASAATPTPGDGYTVYVYVAPDECTGAGSFTSSPQSVSALVSGISNFDAK